MPAPLRLSGAGMGGRVVTAALRLTMSVARGRTISGRLTRARRPVKLASDMTPMLLHALPCVK